MNEQTTRKAGRPTKSPEGKRKTLHINLSPPAVEALEAICRRPIESVSHSAMIEHLIMEQASKQKAQP